MSSFEQLPQRTRSHELEDESKRVFRNSLEKSLFIIQSSDDKDYGTDLQIELVDHGKMTNFRTHVQLKSTEACANKDGSISVAVETSNINYLRRQKFSMYVCYHLPSERLLVWYVDDVIRYYAHKSDDWYNQKTITVKFFKIFDEQFQKDLHTKLLIFSNKELASRHEWNVVPVSEMGSLVRKSKKNIFIPHDRQRAKQLLETLYFEEKDDQTISHYFDEFGVVLGITSVDMNLAYAAEVNLGLLGFPSCVQRVKKAIDIFKREIKKKKRCPSLASMHYCIGNAWLVLKEFYKARSAYLIAIPLMEKELEASQDKTSLGECHKNLGSALEGLEKHEEAIHHYKLALHYSPQLAEAHLALGIAFYKSGTNYQEALDHLDEACFPHETQNMTVKGWRIPLLFERNDASAAFREINSILGYAERHDWILPWCAKHVSEYGVASLETAKKSKLFWLRYLKIDSNHIQAKRACLLCQWYLHERQESVDIDYEKFKNEVIELIENDDWEPAFLWDRIGHWAQVDGDWIAAEIAFRKAYELEPESHYGYCLGTALNFLGRYEEALPILIEQAKKYQPDAMSWFQLAAAYAAIGESEKGINAYNKAIELDPEYDLAFFNLGGVYWNTGNHAEAIQVWNKAIQKFPEHALAQKLYTDLSVFFRRAE